MSEKRRKRHSPEQIVRNLRDADAMLSVCKDQAAVLQAHQVSESTLDRWRKQYGGMKSKEAVRLNKLEDENKRLTQLVAELSLNNQALKIAAEGNFCALPGSERRLPSCGSGWAFPSEGGAEPLANRGAVSVTKRSPAETSRVCSNGCSNWCVVGRGSATAASRRCCGGKATRRASRGSFGCGVERA
jgi:putative transposase